MELLRTWDHFCRVWHVSSLADALNVQARIPDLAPRLDAIAEEYRADVAFAKGNDSAAASAGLDFPARELLDAINAAVEVRIPAICPSAGLCPCAPQCLVRKPMHSKGGPAFVLLDVIMLL